MRRPAAVVAVVAALLAGLLVGPGAGAAAAAEDAGCASFGSSFAMREIPLHSSGLRVGCARDAGVLDEHARSGDDLVAAIDFRFPESSDLLRQVMEQAVTSVRADIAEGHPLSEAMMLRIQRDSVGFSTPGSDVRFGGDIHVVGDSVVLTVPAGDIGTAGFWDGFWKKFLAGVAGIAAGAASTALCLLAFNVGAPAAGPVCGAVGGAMISGVAELVGVALDGKPIDKQAWGQAVGAAVGGAVGGAFLGAAANFLATGSRGLITSAQEAVRRYATIFTNWARPLEFIANLLDDGVARVVLETVERLARGIGGQLRVMPLGDSITYGFASSDGSGYLADFRGLAGAGGQVDLVGSQRSGPERLPNEGHSGWTIGQVAGITGAALAVNRPNVVLLHVGTNDMNNNVDPAGAPARLGSLIDEILRVEPGVTLVVSTIVPAADPATQRRIEAYNRAVPGVVAARRQAGEHVLLVEPNAVTTANLADGLHPDDRGYRKLAVSFHLGVVRAAEAGWIGQPGSGDPDCTDGAGRWIDRGQVASGVGATGFEVTFADIDGDRRDDYLWVHADGAVDAWINTGGDSGGAPGWISRGRIASGVGAPASEVRFADINGDRRDDYLWVHASGAVDAWINTGGDSGGAPGWISRGRIASGAGAGELVFADVSGDDRDDYLRVDDDGSVDAWINTGGDSGGAPGWVPRGQIASGAGAGELVFADMDCDPRDDYLKVDRRSGSVDAWLNTGGDSGSTPGWAPRGRVASGVPEAILNRIEFADLNGDGRDDYLLVNPDDGAVRAYLNNGGDPA
ncbi:GDSL-type esterase/lipase family protein [Saccharothrix algeriensis]|uniref:Lysophospholipase L1-like esterase n=1 Tax=Saccharothrix algeriensis TaxID=173560 RepID=A0ABS2SE89_9PSEU|nr:GDSL-type esterase/lipase family protein [Saccharothrix algeriensis]MBM7814572.1 lysophospholipase L1-like esterase [Saccharothrix algeriensis]